MEDQSQKGTLALVAITQSRARKDAEEEKHCMNKQHVSGVSANSLEQKESDDWGMGTKLDNSVLHGRQE